MLNCRMDGKKRLCFYKGREMTASELSSLDECIVPLPTLTQRISQGIHSPNRTRWDSIEKCLTAEIVKGCPKINRTVERPYEPSYFITVMMMMPIQNRVLLRVGSMTEYTDETKAPDGVYWVTFDNNELALMWKKGKDFSTPEFLARSTLKRIKNHKPVKFESLYHF